MWKENVMEELEAGELEYETVEEFLTSLTKKFGGGDEESVKVVELRKLEQGRKLWRSLYRSSREQQEGVDMREDYW